MRLTTVLALATVVFTIFVFSPAEIYYSDPFEFSITGREFLLTGVLVAFVTTFLGASIFSALVAKVPVSIRERLVALIVSIGVALWVQGTYVGWSLGPLDGRTIRWEDHPLKTLDLLLWAIIIAVPQLVERFRSCASLRRASAVVLVLQSLVLTFHAVTISDFSAFKRYQIDVSNRFELSQDRNVVLLVLDEFQCDVFAELLQDDTSLSEAFRGFTFFRNALAPASQTFPSVPTMLTGIRYNNSIPAPTYLERSFIQHSLFKNLIDHDVRTDVFTLVSDAVLISPEVASNVVTRHSFVNEFLLLLDAGLFRSVPFMFKPMVYRNDRWLTAAIFSRIRRATRYHSADIRSFRDGLANATAQATGTIFKFDHLHGMHVPLKFDENLDTVSPTYSRENYRRQAVGVIGVIQSYLEKLRELNVYNRTLVIIAGDHGSGRSEEMWLQPSNSKQQEFNKFKARGCPLLLVKPLQPEGSSIPNRLQVSSAPVTLLDIPPTIYEALGIEEVSRVAEGGDVGPDMPVAGIDRRKSLFSVAEGSDRPRRYDAYNWKKFNTLYLPPITEYIVNGDVWNDRSWKKGQTFFSPQ